MNRMSPGPVGEPGLAELPGGENGARPRGFPASLRNLSQLTCVAHSNRVIAVSRTICAIMLLVFAMTDRSAAGLRMEFDDLFALAFACLALATVIISLKSWHLDFTLSRASFLADLVIFTVFVTVGLASDTGSVASALCVMAHILFSSVLRWRLITVLAIAVFLNTSWIADLVLFELPRGTADQASTLRWIVFALFETVIVLWVTMRSSKASLPGFDGDNPSPGLPLTVSALGYAMRTAGACTAALSWLDPDDLGCLVCSMAETEDTLPPAPKRLGFAAAAAFNKLEPMLFDLSRDRAITSDDSLRAARTVSPVPGRALLSQLGVETGICVPVDSDEGRSWLILSGIPMLGWGYLQLAHAICAEIMQRINCQVASAKAHDAALFRLRRTLACDLHDSVAHSLAGARFLLGALRSKISANAEGADEIDSITAALDAEHLHVRKLIAQLREEDADTRERNLIEDIEVILPVLEARWQIEVELVDSDFRILVPVWLSLEIQQIVREAVGNGVRHGQATKIAIKCKRSLGTIKLEVTDNGGGFPNPQSPVHPRSIGERVGELGGSLEVRSNPGLTTLRMSIPAAAMD